MNKILFENKVQVLERLILQDIIINYGMQKNSETSYDKLMAKLLDRITEFYEELEPDAISLQKLKPYGDRAKIYTEQLQADLDKAAEVTVRQIVKQLPREKLSGHSLQEVIQAVRPVLKRRMEVLSNLLSASALQKQNYMLLWDYQDEGYTHYKVLTDGDNCDRCNALEGQVFRISDACAGENFPPMHPNCNCWVEFLENNVKTKKDSISDSSYNEPSKIPWDSWRNYEKVTQNGQVYAKVGNRLYSKHAVDRMQPSGNRFGPNITQGYGTDYGRSIAPQYVEDIINSTKGIFQPETGNYVHHHGTVKVIVNPQGAVVTIITYQ